METLSTEFVRLGELSVLDVMGEIGVYVLWGGRSLARPTYIGEGNLLTRLANHDGRFPEPLDGYACILEEPTWQRAKARAEIVEALLLKVAKETDRTPAINRAAGKLRGLDRIFRAHGTLRVTVSGFDPLQAPWHAKPLTRRKLITLRDQGNGDITVAHDWRLRRLMR